MANESSKWVELLLFRSPPPPPSGEDCFLGALSPSLSWVVLDEDLSEEVEWVDILGDLPDADVGEEMVL